jgi:pyrroloquinoline-quinone synthase
MEIQEFFDQLDECIRRYDLLRHPFYQAWSRGDLTREDLRSYARDYYYQVVSFPRCLSEFARRLSRSELREAVLTNLNEELGRERERSHADLWLDFTEGVGSRRSLLGESRSSQMKGLVSFFKRVAKNGTPEQVLTAFYVYESQVPRISQEKLRGLREMYGADDHTCQYFILHTTADVQHAEVWRRQIEKCLRSNVVAGEPALKTAEAAALALWVALDGFESARLQKWESRN